MPARAPFAVAARACALVACIAATCFATAAAGAAEPGAAASAPTALGAPGPAASAPPVSVSVVRAARRDVTVDVEATGTFSALSNVDVKPQIASVVTAVHVKEGQFVAKGQPLFTLDDRADQANLAKAEAQLLRDQATLADAERQLVRAQDLLAKSFVSQGAVDTARTQVDAQRAAVAADKAAIAAARVAVSYGRIVAPGAGRVGQINVYVGSSVAPGGPAMLTLTQLDPIALAFSLPQRYLPDALRLLGEGRAPAAPSQRRGPAPTPAATPDSKAPAGPAPGSVLAVLPDGRGTRVGRLHFVDSAVDAASGTVRVKALFANADQALWPGAYATVQLALQSLPGALVIPQATIVQGARGTAVFVVDEQAVAALRPVKVLQPLGTDAAVSGLRPGEKVVLDGRQNLRPGMRVAERAAERGAGAAGGRAGEPGGAASRPGRPPSDGSPPSDGTPRSSAP